jgi:hypothetical protein
MAPHERGEEKGEKKGRNTRKGILVIDSFVPLCETILSNGVKKQLSFTVSDVV